MTNRNFVRLNFMCFKKICFVILTAVVVFAQPSDPHVIPDTPAGRTFRAWFEAFNSGDRQRMQAYLQQYEPGKTVEFERMIELRNMSGGFELLGIDKSEPLHLEFRVKERASETTASGQLYVKSGDPAIVDHMRLRARAPASQAAGAEGPPQPLDPPTRSRVIDGTIKTLDEFYVFPETAKKMEEALRGRQQHGEYDSVTSGEAFAELLTSQLQEISHDKHLDVNYSASPLPAGDPGSNPEDHAQFRKQMERMNCGFEKAERLEGNIGYLKFNMFADPQVCGPTAIAAMNFLADTGAIIFDLRSNGGGDPAMVALISSYLFAEPTHLNDMWDRKAGTTQQFWTASYVPGKRMDTKPVFVLTSAFTFSGAEEFSYNLKNLKRATIVGEVTGGGAHPVAGHRIDDHFTIGVPFARAINPISKGDWEGTGVEPDVRVPAADALSTALKMARPASISR